MRDIAELLATTFSVFSDALSDRAGFSLPERRYITVGAPAYDCESFVVRPAGLYQGIPGQRLIGYQVATGGMSTFSAEITLLLIRSVPVLDNLGNPPRASAETAAALVATADGTALSEVYFDAGKEIAGDCQWSYYGGLSWVGPQGGLIGTEMTIAVEL